MSIVFLESRSVPTSMITMSMSMNDGQTTVRTMPENNGMMIPPPSEPTMEQDEEEMELPPQFNAPDLFEEDPEIVKAEVGFFQTPHSNDYSEVVYGTLKNIEGTCALDYASLCVSKSSPSLASMSSMSGPGAMISLPDFMSQMGFDISFMPAEEEGEFINGGRRHRRRNLAAVHKPSASSFMKDVHTLLIDPIATTKRHVGRKLWFGHGGRDWESDSEGEDEEGEEHRHHHDHGHHDEGSVSGGAPAYVEGNPGTPELVEMTNNNEEEEGGEMVDMPCPHSQEEEDLAEDTFFTGALGFGVMGDMCMYQNFDTLSLPCQSTITDLHELREQYWNEEYEMNEGPGYGGGRWHHHAHPGVALLFWFCAIPLMFMLGRKLKRKMIKRQQVINVLSAIEKNPALKAQVEAEAGMSLPNLQEPCRFNVCRFFLTAIAAFFTSLFVTITSVMVASNIVVSLRKEDPLTGEAQYPPPEAALGILFATVVVEVVAVAMLIRTCRRMRMNRRQQSNNNVQYDAASAPVMSATANMMQPQSPTFTAVLLRGHSSDNNNDSEHGDYKGTSINQSTSSSAGTTTATSAMARDNVVVAINNMRKSITGLTRGLTTRSSRTPSAAAAAEGGYSVLPADEVNMTIVTGVPITAQQQQGSAAGVNWI